ncbi:MAG: sugar ABC transporter permease [Anaerolineae bacterium]|nr:sugar ABC transporter permease [Anaerolineae bacterium]
MAEKERLVAGAGGIPRAEMWRGSDATTLARIRREARKALRKPQFWFGLAVLVPSLIWYGIFSFGPILQAFPMAFRYYKIVDPAHSPWVGLDNFRFVLGDQLLRISAKNTVTWAVLAFTLMLPLSLFISVCLANVARGRNLYQAIIFLPVVVSLVAVSLLFRMVLDPEVGQVNRLLAMLSLPQPRWLSDTKTALLTCVLIGTWKGLGFHVVILTAGILNIPTELYDAAQVDGVNEWQRFRHITLPLLGHTLLLITVLLAIGCLQEFTAPFVLTEGGPGTATYTYNMFIYKEAFQQMRFGIATAAALLQFAVILVITLLQLKLLRPQWSY